jgi:hypothetical protein
VKFRYSNLEFLIVMEFQYSKRHQKSLWQVMNVENQMKCYWLSWI